MVFVGAPLEDGGAGDPATDAGAVYVFSRNQGGPDAWGQVAILHASDQQAEDWFGFPIVFSGDMLLVGALREDGGVGDSLPDSGAVYVFKQVSKSSWTQAAILHASDSERIYNFGNAISIFENTMVVGANGESSRSFAGSAYIFKRDQGGIESWIQTTILRASDRAAGDWFGNMVAINGGNILVSAPFKSGEPGINAGAVYVFKNIGPNIWDQAAILRASDKQAGDNFGISMDMSGEILVVGASDEDGGAGDPLPNSGTAYVFSTDNAGVWTQVAILRASDGEEDDRFGNSVAISGDTIAVGAPQEGEPLLPAGAVYLFHRAGPRTVFLPLTMR